jgi:hypothetical protein
MRAYVPAILFATAVARCETLTDPQFRELAQRCVPDADLPTLRSIVKLTSGFEVNSVRLSNDDSRSSGHVELERQPVSRQEAIRWSRWMAAEGIPVTLGLAGLSLANLQEVGVPLDRAFEPCVNLRIGWRLFERKYNTASVVLGKGPAAEKAALRDYLRTTPKRIDDVNEQEETVDQTDPVEPAPPAAVNTVMAPPLAPVINGTGLESSNSSTTNEAMAVMATKVRWNTERAQEPWIAGQPAMR